MFKGVRSLIEIFNTIVFPLKVVIPQPIIKKMPGLTSNEEIRFNVVLKEIKGRLLDVGCGNNRLVKKYQSCDGQGLGIDIYPWEGVDMVLDRSDKLPFKSDSFDTVTFVACLNHIGNRQAVLKEVKRVLKSDGVLLITMPPPFLSRLWHMYAFWDEDQHERGMEEDEVYGFTFGEMKSLLTSTGFKLIKVKRFMWKLNNLYVSIPR